jgi:hypothetical protein
MLNGNKEQTALSHRIGQPGFEASHACLNKRIENA